VSWNAKDDLRECLKSLEKFPLSEAMGTMQVVVVDNSSKDGSDTMVETEFPNVTLVRSGANLGFGGGNNLCYKNLDADYAFLLNSDAFVHEGSLDTLISFANANPKAGFIGPKVLNLDGSIQYSCRRWPTFAAGVFRNVYLGKLFPKNAPASDYLMQDFDHNSTIEVDWLSGCALLVRRECLEEIGPLDEKTFFMYCEDMDWSLRAFNAGWKVMYYHEAIITHKIGGSSDAAADRMIMEHSRSMWRLYNKHKKFFAERVPFYARPIVLPGLFLRAIMRIVKRRFLTEEQKKTWRR
jgi:GT2 family glycosyltransferase